MGADSSAENTPNAPTFQISGPILGPILELILEPILGPI